MTTYIIISLLETVVSSDPWIWHVFFGVVGSNNDINILERSPLFNWWNISRIGYICKNNFTSTRWEEKIIFQISGRQQKDVERACIVVALCNCAWHGSGIKEISLELWEHVSKFTIWLWRMKETHMLIHLVRYHRMMTQQMEYRNQL